MDMVASSASGGMVQIRTPTVRKEFPETWIWDELDGFVHFTLILLHKRFVCLLYVKNIDLYLRIFVTNLWG